VSHSFSDEHYTGGVEAFRAAITALFNRVAQILSHEGDSFLVQCRFVASDYERTLPTQLRRLIRDSDFLLADITGESPNVLYELGFATALDIPLLVIRQHGGNLPPCDIRDMLVGFYETPQELPDKLAPSLARVVAQGLSTHPITRRSSTLSIAKVWFPEETKEVHIICSPEPERSRFASKLEPNYLFVDNLEDRDALLEMAMFLSRQYPHASILKHSSDTVGPDVLTSNLVVLGGPGDKGGPGNQITRELMTALASGVRYGEGLSEMLFGEAKLMPEFRQDGAVMKDWATLLAAPNPVNPYARVILCHGVYTYGTMAAVQVLSDLPGAMSNHIAIREIFGETNPLDGIAFETVFSVSVVAGGRISFPKITAGFVRRLE
jgi:hypothetical protein